MRATGIIEIGPVSVRRLCCDADESIIVADAESAAAVLDGGDDPMVLLGSRPVAVDELWCAVLEPLLRGVDAAVLIHPSWWPAARVEAVSGAAGRAADAIPISIVTRSRASLMAVVARDGAVVEVAPHLVVVTVGGGSPLAVETRSATTEVVADTAARAVLRETHGVAVWFDGPAGVPGAEALTALIGDRLRSAGRSVHRLDERDLIRAAASMMKDQEAQDNSYRRPDRRRLAAAACTVLTVAAVAGMWGARRADGPVLSRTTALVEGRVTMDVPADWAVRRITAGPGSARVQVVSPTDVQTALHMTQSRVRDEDLAAAAGILRRAIDAEAPGVFVDFDPSDVRAGRPAVTYREVRPGHDIRWTVVLDGAVRISIGCQSAAGAERDVAAACEQAVRSAHEIR